MKLINKLGAVALSSVMMTSCAVHDPFANHMEIGQELPTVSWELGSSLCKAGNDVSFRGKYYSKEHGIDHIEVWAMVTRTESAAATVALTNSLKYTLTIAVSDTARSSQKVASYPHSMATFDGYEYILDATFPTSRTLAPIAWVTPETWDQEKFDSYYPANFQAEFKKNVVNFLTKDSTYYADLRSVYIKYDFPASTFEALNAKYGVDFPTTTDTGEKSDAWYVNTEKVVAKYYTTIDAAGNTIVHEIPVDQATDPSINYYDVYDSSPWVFCRYSDNTGSAITSVRAEWMPYLKELIETISFTDWIYDSANKNFKVDFSRKYRLHPTFKVYDDNGKVGYDTDKLEVELN